MYKFLILLEGEHEQVAALVQEHYANFNYELIEKKAWVVAANETTVTPADVCKKIGLTGTEQARMGVVVRFETYYGYADAALWQKLQAWGRA